MTDKSGQLQLDTRALELATESRARIDAHERDCGARYTEVAAAMRDIKGDIARNDVKRSESLQRIYNLIEAKRDRDQRLWRTLYIGAIAVLLSAIGYLITAGVPWGGG